MPMPETHSPRLDVPSLAVHALWGAWFTGVLLCWSSWSVGARLGAMGVGWAVMFWNYAVLHNHMHVPIAKPRALKWLVSRTLGLACGFAYRGYYIHHFNHHKYNDGPGDWGRPRPGEGALQYCARWVFTTWFWPWAVVGDVWKACKTRGQKLELVLDFALVDGLLLALLAWQPSLAASLFAMLLVGQLSIHYLNLAAHLGSDSTDRKALAVTSVSPFYNRYFFNAGYHLAHHLKPQLPWRGLPALTEELLRQGQHRPALLAQPAPIHPAWIARVFAFRKNEGGNEDSAPLLDSGPVAQPAAAPSGGSVSAGPVSRAAAAARP
jgi:fatty acid desaturase